MIEMLRCYHLVFHPPLKLSRLNDARHRIQPGDDEAFDLRALPTRPGRAEVATAERQNAALEKRAVWAG